MKTNKILVVVGIKVMKCNTLKIIVYFDSFATMNLK